MERDEYQQENEGLRKVLAITQAKHKKELTKAKTELAKARESLRERTRALDETTAKSQEEAATNGFLREDLTETKGRAAALELQLESCRREIDALKQGQGQTLGLERHYRRLAKELDRCVGDLHSLSSVTKQLLEGQEPSVSMLLGIKDYRSQQDSAASSGEETDGGSLMPLTQRLDEVERQCAKVKEIRADIRSIREGIAEKYAETLGDNMTSCTTQ